MVKNNSKKIEKDNMDSKKRWIQLGYIFLLCGFLPITIFLKNWAVKNPGWIEEVYAAKWYHSFSQPWSMLFSSFNFSFIEIFIYTLIIGLIVSIILSLISAFRECHGLYTLIKWIVSLAGTACVLYFFFNVGWALNYYRRPLAQTMEYNNRLSDSNELSELCEELIENANTVREELNEDIFGIVDWPYSHKDALQMVPQVYNNISKKYPMFDGEYSAPKPVLASSIMNYTQITGIFLMFTMEANVNVAVESSLFLSTACHEAAHQRGFAREDEANFISYLVCREGGDEYFKYSGTLLALINSMNQLYATDEDKYYELRGTYSDDVNADLYAQTLFWQKYEGPVAEKTEAFNDTYLKSNKQEDGIKSYGRMVDLLLAERRYRLGIS
ncbi:MAG: DUF3810 domain-containing protein [Clostridiales bacterium]|nr:DUF3810 domain-containing protein [Clostridiales bacterium]